MRGALTVTVAIVVSLAAVALPANAQWLNHPTPNIPRTSDGKPNLAAPAPRAVDGHLDLSGPWTGRPGVIGVPDEALTATSKALVREREENYFKDRPAFNCQPSGPETDGRLEAHHPDALTHRDRLRHPHVPPHFHGRPQARSRPRTHVDGYSVGRWEGDTLVVDSFGFNDRTWLDGRGLPHTEALRTTERYVRRNLGQLQVELTVTDPGAFAKPWTMTYDLEFQADTEMIESVCEERSRWIGHLSDVEQSAVTVAPQTLAKYVGVYSGLWVTRPRTVRIQLEGGTLYANGLLGEKVRLIPHSETSFSGTDGLSFDFDPDGNPAAFMVERHVSGDWRYTRQPQR